MTGYVGSNLLTTYTGTQQPYPVGPTEDIAWNYNVSVPAPHVQYTVTGSDGSTPKSKLSSLNNATTMELVMTATEGVTYTVNVTSPAAYTFTFIATASNPTPAPTPAAAATASPAPTTAPTPTPTATPVSSPTPIVSAGTFDGCPYFTNGVFTTDISNASLDPNSAAYIQATMDGGDAGSFNVWIPDDEYVNLANNSTPTLNVQPISGGHNPAIGFQTSNPPVPWASTFKISPLGDHHSLVLQTQNCSLSEMYDSSYNSSANTLSAYSGGQWNLKNSYIRPTYGAISTASGIPLSILAVKPEDFATGVIQHALGWGGVAHSVSYNTCVNPAGQYDCTDGLSYNGPSTDTPMPYGAHIRLKATFNDSAFPREAYIVAEALKHYGAYLYDTGCCDEIPFTDDAYGSMSSIWTSADGSAISSLKITDFDVVAPPN